jgi:hypothetical protein
MTRSAKTVSIRHLQAAVKTALDAAKKAHPDIDPVATTSASGPVPILYLYPYICGLPPSPWPLANLGSIAEFNNVFVANLAKEPAISAVAPNGTFEPTVSYSAGKVSIGFVPDNVSLTE